MKVLFKTLAVASVLALPISMQAQAPVDPTVQVSINSFPWQTTGTGYSSLRGGGFRTDFMVDFPGDTRSFNDWLVWCIDPTRGTNVGRSDTYSLYTLVDFDLTGFGTATNDPTLANMNEIASITQDLEDNWAALSVGDRQQRQGQIWDNFTGNNLSPYVGDAGFDGSNWYVLFNDRNQTFLTRIPDPVTVPEPTSMALMGLGIAGLAVVRRRRNA